MRKLIFLLAIFFLFSCSSDNSFDEQIEQAEQKVGVRYSESPTASQLQTTENLIVITLDGVRWQEVLGEADVLDIAYLSQIGNLYGDRNQGNLVNVANRSRVSYPGYHELFTGNTTRITGNNNGLNPHKTVFEYIHEQPDYGNKNVQVIGMWTKMRDLFRVSETTSVFPVFTPVQLDTENRVIDAMPYLLQTADIDVYTEAFEEVLIEFEIMLPSINRFNRDAEGELLGYLIAKKSMEKINPKVAYLQFSESDARAHAGDWEGYIKASKNVGIYIKDLITFINSNDHYSGKTTILITTDHGRGTTNWKRHGHNITGSDQTWFIMISPYTNLGVVTEQKQYYNEQMAQTMANILGFTYEAEHEIADALEL